MQVPRDGPGVLCVSARGLHGGDQGRALLQDVRGAARITWLPAHKDLQDHQ